MSLQITIGGIRLSPLCENLLILEMTRSTMALKTPFPGAQESDFRKALALAKLNKPDVLVLVLFGKDMSQAIRVATAMGLKNDMQIVVPNLTLGMAELGGPKVMEGVIGALPWTWKVLLMNLVTSAASNSSKILKLVIALPKKHFRGFCLHHCPSV